MKLLLYIFRSSRRIAVLIALAGVVSGLCSAGLIAAINSALHKNLSIPAILIAAVIFLGLGKVIMALCSRRLLLRYTQKILIDLRVDLCQRILAAPYRRLEELGPHRILTVLTDDVLVLGQAIHVVPALAITAAVVIGGATYLLWLSPLGFAMLFFVLLVGIGIYKLLYSQAFRAIFLAREGRDRLMKYFRALTEGLKELKMNEARQEEFLAQNVEVTAEEVKHHNLIAGRRLILVDAWNQGLFYLLTGSMLVVFPMISPESPEVLSGYIFASIYIMAPVWSIIGALPTFFRGQVSLDKIDELGVSLGERADPGGTVTSKKAPLSEDTALELKEVEFSYGNTEDRDFTLGPLDFSLRPGEVVFVVGGNGSGKSTLVKLLSGLYAPLSGDIRLGGTAITDANREWYRQHFSVVFSDFFVFESLLGAAQSDLDSLSREYLERLQLEKKVRISSGAFSTTALSQGQRKRLALLTALIEDRPICIFDEWAADQDPQYKETFYKQLLPELKASGKAVVVITHDDRYFREGDRVVKLEEGRALLEGSVSRSGEKIGMPR